MNVILNGKPRTIDGAQTVGELVRELQLVPATVLVEHNGVALHRGEWNTRAIDEGDFIELVSVVAGG